MDRKKGLVLGGGGSRGSYEIGIIRALNEKGLTFDVVTGTSIGSIIGCVYVQDPRTDLSDWIGQFTSEGVDKDLFIFPDQYQVKSLYGQPGSAFFDMFCGRGPAFGPLADTLGPILNYEKFKASAMDYACIAYNVTEQKGQIFGKEDFQESNMADIVLASSAYFPAFNMKRLGNEYFIDGGYCDTVPSDVARDMGAEKLVIVDLSDGDVPLPHLEPEDVFIRPIRRLSYYLDFDGKTLRAQAQQGYLEGLKYLSMAPGYLYTFFSEDWSRMELLEKGALKLLKKEGHLDLLEKLPQALDQIYEFLLGYVPVSLHNDYSESFRLGRLLECMGVIAGVDMNVQIHFGDFLRAILRGFNEFTEGPRIVSCHMASNMEMKGLQDMLVFFHSALISYGGDLPTEFGIFKEKYILPYYLAQGWRIMESLRLVLGLI